MVTKLGWRRTVVNYQGRPVAVAGLGLVAGLAAGLAVLWMLPAGRAGFVAVAGFGLLGAADDRWGDRTASGFRGHLRAARAGRFTTGFWKIVGGGFVALAAAWMLGAGWNALLRALVVALGANALNLLDTRPARASAAFLALCGLATLAGGARAVGAPGLAAAAVWLPWDRGRRAMLGDAGSNALGALWAVVAVAGASWIATLVLLAILVAFHVYAEARSLNADLAATPWLRRVDGWVRGDGDGDIPRR